ncbi:ureidoglycolate lyase [Sneathiella limimaris]|uniref:ureidoglycolate lyase n=1 Tax=Sneathiella limimaris TaxID=1964213 RepID=UPI00146A9BD8|nr:ureidoglycolate lyase [Sneathiella limimaris]
MKLDLKPLTKEAFAPYGDVIETSGSDYFLINNGSTRRYHDLAKIEILEGGRPLINIFQATPLSYPLAVKMVERHPHGSQAFIPLGSNPYLVLVAKAGEDVTPEDLEAFIATSDQGVNYHAGTWHHPVLALDGVSDFLVVDRGGEGHNCDEFFFAEDLEILLDRS